MNRAAWQRVKEILDAVDAAPGGQREQLLTELCGGDSELRGEVESLLSFEDDSGVLERGAERLRKPPLRQIGPYSVHRVLGTGGMGAVYLAERDDDQYRKKVAIKIIPNDLDPQLLSRFRSERQILADIEHPNIARMLDGGTLPDGRPYLVMEYIEGRPVDVWRQEQSADAASILRLFLKICAAVQFVHRNLVVHRDLKPGNILVTADGEPHLLDFGIAKLLGPTRAPDVETTQPWQRLMTPASASPEQVAGEPVTTAADVYSLDVLLYTLLTGKSPYAAAEDFAVNPARVILEYEPPLASQAPDLDPKLRRYLRGDLENILRKATEKDPGRRYLTVEEFAADLRLFLEGRPVTARPASMAYRARKFVARNRLLAGAAAMLFLAIAAGVAGTLLYASRAHEEQAIAERRFESLNKLTNSMLFEIDGAIANLPGAMPAREAVVKRALEYLNEMAADSRNNQTVLLNLADAYIRVGQIQANALTAHTGGAGSLAAGVESYNKAGAIVGRLAAANPADLNLQLKLLGTRWFLAAGHCSEGALEECLAIHAASRQKFEELLARYPDGGPGNQIRYGLGSECDAAGDVYLQLGRTGDAGPQMRRSLAVRQEILGQDPASARAMRVVAISHEYLSYYLEAVDRYPEAAEQQRAGLTLIQRAVAADPRNVDLETIEANQNQNLCRYLTHSGRFSEARGLCLRAIEIDRVLMSDEANVQAISDSGSAHSSLSGVLEGTGQLADAIQEEQEAKTLFHTAMARDPDSLETATEGARSLLHLGSLESRAGRRADAERDLQAAGNILALAARRIPLSATIRTLERQADSELLALRKSPQK